MGDEIGSNSFKTQPEYRPPSFHEIAVSGDERDASFCYAACADVEERNESTQTALMVAASAHNVGVIYAMLAYGANINAQSASGLTFFDYWLETSIGKEEKYYTAYEEFSENNRDVRSYGEQESILEPVHKQNLDTQNFINAGAQSGKDISDSTLRKIIPHPWLGLGVGISTLLAFEDFFSGLGPSNLLLIVIFLISNHLIGVGNRLWARLYDMNMNAINRTMDYWYLQLDFNFDPLTRDLDEKRFQESWDANAHIKTNIWRQIISKYLTPPESYYSQSSILQQINVHRSRIRVSLIEEKVVPEFVQATSNLDFRYLSRETDLDRILKQMTYNGYERHWVSAVMTLLICVLIFWLR